MTSSSSAVTTFGEAFTIREQLVESQTLAFIATSLEVAPSFLLSLSAWRVRDLRPIEVDMITRLFEKAEFGLTRENVLRAMYIGRTRRSRATNKVFADEPCLYLLFPDLKSMNDKTIETLLDFVLIPALKLALADHLQSANSTFCPILPKVQHSHRGSDIRYGPMEHQVHGNQVKGWDTPGSDDPPEEVVAARKDILRRMWDYMEDITELSSNKFVAENFRNMTLLVLVPDTNHCGTEAASTVKEVLDLYDRELNQEHVYMRNGRMRVSVEYDLTEDSPSEVSS